MSAPSTIIHSEDLAEAGRVQVHHEEDQSRYTVVLNEQIVGVADYFRTAHAVHFTHTEVDREQRQLGLASILVEQALMDVRSRTALPVVPDCSYVARWIDRHHDYQFLLTRHV